MVIIGTKRPCSYCRRVLLAFDHALKAHYPDIEFHYVNRTGATIDPIDCLELGGANGVYKDFAADYSKKLKDFLEKQEYRTLDDERLEGNDVRTKASAEIAFMT